MVGEEQRVVPEGLKRLVVDTNIVFSTLQKCGATRKLFFFMEVELYAPNFLMVEVIKNKEKIVSTCSMDEGEFISIIHRVFNRINFVNERLISLENRIKAYEMCKDVDEADAPFVALALEIDAPLWSGDKKLASGLKDKGFDKVLTNYDLSLIWSINHEY